MSDNSICKAQTFYVNVLQAVYSISF